MTPHRYDRTGDRVDELDGDEDLEQVMTPDERKARFAALRAELAARHPDLRRPHTAGTQTDGQQTGDA